MERYQEQKKDLHIIFINLKKVYDKIPKNIMWWTFKKKWALTKYITLIKDMYTNVLTYVRACDGESDAFPNKIGLRQESMLSQYIFILVINDIKKYMQGDIPWCMVFADDVMLIDENKIGDKL
jgi:Reverse transcriptase (RNA-dependent DNA polymerase)